LIRKISNNDLISSLLETNKQSEEQCKAFLQSYFCKELTNHSEDLFLDQMKINLLDPIDFQSIKTPCRGRFCRHFNCFSLETFIAITRDSSPRKWRCPICKKPCYEFLIDGYLLKIIEDARVQNKILKEMIIFDDGKFEIVEEVPWNEDGKSDKDEANEEKGGDKIEKSKDVTQSNERFSVVIEEKGDLNDGLSEFTKSTTMNEDKSQKIENGGAKTNGIKKRKFKDVDGKEEKDKKDNGGYHLRSKKMCLNK